MNRSRVGFTRARNHNHLRQHPALSRRRVFLRFGLTFLGFVLPAMLSACSSTTTTAASGVTRFAASPSSLTSRGGSDTLTWASSATGFTLQISPSAGVIVNGAPYAGPVVLPGIANSARVTLPPNSSATTSTQYTFTLAANGTGGSLVASKDAAKATVSPVSYSVFSGAAYAFAAPAGVAVDAAGNVWIANSAGAGGGSLTEIPAGATSAPTVYADSSQDDPFDVPIGVAVDGSGNVWVTNNSAGSSSNYWVTEVPAANAGAPVRHASTLFSRPYGIAIDGVGNIWVTDTAGANAVTELPAGHPGSPVRYTSASFNVTAGIAVDRTGNVWVVDSGGSGSVTEIPVVPNGNTVFNGSAYDFSSPRGIAVDPSGNIWVSNENGNSVTDVPAGNPSSPRVFSAVSYAFAAPSGVAVDGSGNIWVANSAGAGGGSLTEIPAKTPADPVVYAATAYGFAEPQSVAVDGDGNVWVTNAVGSTSKHGSVTELKGAATPMPFHVPLGP